MSTNVDDVAVRGVGLGRAKHLMHTLAHAPDTDIQEEIMPVSSTAMYFVFGLLLLCALAAAFGLVEARARGRNTPGRIVSIVASIIGAVGGAMAVGAAMDASGAFKEAGPLVDTLPMIAGLLLGAWLALMLLNRFRD